MYLADLLTLPNICTSTMFLYDILCSHLQFLGFWWPLQALWGRQDWISSPEWPWLFAVLLLTVEMWCACKRQEIVGTAIRQRAGGERKTSDIIERIPGYTACWHVIVTITRSSMINVYRKLVISHVSHCNLLPNLSSSSLYGNLLKDKWKLFCSIRWSLFVTDTIPVCVFSCGQRISTFIYLVINLYTARWKPLQQHSMTYLL